MFLLNKVYHYYSYFEYIFIISKMGERLSIMSNEELIESRNDLIGKLKAINGEIEARKRSLGEREIALVTGAGAAGTASGSTTTKKKVVKIKREEDSSITESTRPKSAAAIVSKPTVAAAAAAVPKKKKTAAVASSAAASGDSNRKINATIADMKAILDQNGIEYSSIIKKDELDDLIRANYLVRKAEARCADRKKNSAAKRSAAAAEDSD